VGVMFAVIVLLTVVFVDYVTKHSIYYQTASIFRKLVKPELYDDTYSPRAVWPIEGGEPFKVRATFTYKSEPYTLERTVRCYQDRNFSEVSSQEFFWKVQLGAMPVPLKDGGMFYSGIPNLCDAEDGLNKTDILTDRTMPFKYIDNVADPTYVERFTRNKRKKGNIAISQGDYTVDPRSVVVSAFSVENTNVTYTSNVDEGRYAALFIKRAPSGGTGASRKEISFSFVKGFVFFETQWRQNSKLVKFLETVKKPTVIPSELILGVPHEPRNSQLAAEQVNSFYASKNLQSVHQNLGEVFYTWLKLKDQFRWEIDFSSFGVERAFRRGCDDSFENCSMERINRKTLKPDELVIAGISFDIASQPAIYLPNEKIIIQVISPRTYSIFLM